VLASCRYLIVRSLFVLFDQQRLGSFSADCAAVISSVPYSSPAQAQYCSSCASCQPRASRIDPIGTTTCSAARRNRRSTSIKHALAGEEDFSWERCFVGTCVQDTKSAQAHPKEDSAARAAVRLHHQNRDQVEGTSYCTAFAYTRRAY